MAYDEEAYLKTIAAQEAAPGRMPRSASPSMALEVSRGLTLDEADRGGAPLPALRPQPAAPDRKQSIAQRGHRSHAVRSDMNAREDPATSTSTRRGQPAGHPARPAGRQPASIT
ncbi:MAG: hypothetical protein MZW92_16940 [Comamonadaceae bacterium]|nr:hypothetical protein [Comamonadaceae bacterium]